MTDRQLEDVVRKKIDVVLSLPVVRRYELIARYYKDADVILDAIHNIAPEYIVSAEHFFSEKLFCGGNIVLARKEIYNEYYDWMFQVLGECEKIWKETQRQSVPRLWGYAGELLTNIFFMHHIGEYKILFSFMKDLY